MDENKVNHSAAIGWFAALILGACIIGAANVLGKAYKDAHRYIPVNEHVYFDTKLEIYLYQPTILPMPDNTVRAKDYSGQ